MLKEVVVKFYVDVDENQSVIDYVRAVFDSDYDVFHLTQDAEITVTEGEE